MKREEALIFLLGWTGPSGQWRNTGLRLTFAVKDKVHRISSPEPQELIEQAQEIIHYYAKPSAVTRRLDSLATFGELFDYIWSMRKHGLSVENLEGVDPLTGAWVSLRKPSQWAQDNPNGNGA